MKRIRIACWAAVVIFCISLAGIPAQAKEQVSPLCRQSLAIPSGQTAALKKDGTVVVTKNTYFNKAVLPDTTNWKGIVQIDSSDLHMVGLKSDGTVVASGGKNEHGQNNVQNWTDIVQVRASNDYTLGLKSDGTVMYAGDNEKVRQDISQWKNIKKLIIAGFTVAIGIDAEGVIYSTNYTNGYEEIFKRAFASWTDIEDILMLGPVAVGLRTDGTLVTVGEETDPYYIDRTRINGWKDIVQIKAGRNHVLGLKSDGTVVGVGLASFRNYGQFDVKAWKGIREIAAGDYYSVSLKSDGTLVFKGENPDGQGNITKWKDIEVPGKRELTKAKKMPQVVLSLQIDGKPVTGKAQPFFDGMNKIQAPVGPVCEALNASTAYGKDNKVTITAKDRKIQFTIGKKGYWVNDLFMEMDAAPVMKNGAAYVSVYTLGRVLRCDVEYDPVTKKAGLNPIRRESIPYQLTGAKAFTGKTKKVGGFIGPDFRDTGFSLYKSDDDRKEVSMCVDDLTGDLNVQVNALANTLIQKVDEKVVRQIIDHIMPKLTAYIADKDRTYTIEEAYILDPKTGRYIEIERPTYTEVYISYLSDSYSKQVNKWIASVK